MNEDSFIAAILNDADDHAARLAFADWLCERDDPREVLVRAQGALGPSLSTPAGGKMVPIPAGDFVMGSPDDEFGRDPDEQAHPISITRPFYLGATPVTLAEFRTFVRDSGYDTTAETTIGRGWNAEVGQWEYGPYNWREPGWEQDRDEPVVCVSMADAEAFCEWLGRDDGRFYRLPTEAEWEYACRAGTQTPFSFGGELRPSQANFDHRFLYDPNERGSAGPGRTTAVRSHPANGFGLYDMHGNAWEWCADWYDESFYQRSRRRRDPVGPSIGQGHVLRGGAWCVGARDCRSALRRCGHLFHSRYHDGATGFRVALDVPRAERRRKRR